MDRRTEFSRLIAENQAIVHKVCHLYSDRCDHEDLFQEIVLQLWKSFPSFDSDRNVRFSTWMYKVAFNTAATTFRRKLRRPESSAPVIQDVADQAELPVDDELEKAIEIQRLHTAIRKLGEVDRAIILLFLDGNPYTDIAEVVGMTETNIGVRLNRIKKKLRKIFESEL